MVAASDAMTGLGSGGAHTINVPDIHELGATWVAKPGTDYQSHGMVRSSLA